MHDTGEGGLLRLTESVGVYLVILLLITLRKVSLCSNTHTFIEGNFVSRIFRKRCAHCFEGKFYSKVSA